MSKVSKTHYMDFNALNAMYVKDIKDGILSFYTNTAYRVMVLFSLMSKVSEVSNTMYCTLYAGPLTPPGGKACIAFRLVDLA